MENNLIRKICGLEPDNFIKATPADSTYIFENDPNFPALNLYDFFGRSATVNSYTECFYYVELGFVPTITTIFDIGLIILQVLISVFLIYKFLKSNFYKKFINTLKSFRKIQGVLTFFKNKNVQTFMIGLSFFIQIYFLFDYIRTKAVRIPRFIDEYITIAAVDSFFFKGLDFNAGEFLGGNYSLQITSGPISAVGSVIGLNITDKLIIARISNFFWVYLLQIIFVLLIIKLYGKDLKFLLLINGLFLVLIPWWFGSLYSLGEIPSALIFINAIFLFNKQRILATILFSVCIFYGKLLNLVPFVGFYIMILLKERNLKNILKDFLYFSIPLSSWLLLANIKYENGNVFQYIKDQYNFVLAHRSSGIAIQGEGFVNTFVNSILFSEYSTWNNFDKFRVIFVPIIFIFILLKNKYQINQFFGYIVTPLISSLLFSYIWFWILNSTKWIRHTQHYIIPIVICLVYLINFKIIESKIDLLMGVSLLAIFIENNKYLILLSILISIYIIYFIKESSRYSLVKFFLVFILFIDISIPYFQKDTFGNLNHIIQDCKNELVSLECRSAYMNE